MYIYVYTVSATIGFGKIVGGFAGLKDHRNLDYKVYCLHKQFCFYLQSVLYRVNICVFITFVHLHMCI